MKPLTQPETDQLLILLRKIWKYPALFCGHIKGIDIEGQCVQCGESRNEKYIASIAKSLFALITKKMYEPPEIRQKRCQKCSAVTITSLDKWHCSNCGQDNIT